MENNERVPVLTDEEASWLVDEVLAEVKEVNSAIDRGAAARLDPAGSVMFQHHAKDMERAVRLARWGLAKQHEAEDARTELATLKRTRIAERRVLRDASGRV